MAAPPLPSLLANTLQALEARRTTIDGPSGPVSYLEWGQGEPVLWLHGLADHAGVWLHVAEALGDRYHSIAPDLRGHGHSSKPAHGYRCADHITDLTCVMEQAGWDSAHVVAHSWSAKVAAVWARQRPSRFRSLVLVDPFFINMLPTWMALTFPLLYRVLPFLKLMGPFATYEQAEEQARQLKQYRGWSDLQQVVFHMGMVQMPDGQWASRFVKQARDEIFDDVMRVAGLVEPMDVPTLLIQPNQGLNRTAWQLQPYRTYFTQLRLQPVPGNHWCFLVEPEAFFQAIAPFFDQQATPSDPRDRS